MASPFSEKFIIATCDPREIQNKRIIEVGSAFQAHESIQHLFSTAKEFISVDLVQRFNTTHILNAEQLTDHFGEESFDFLVSLFMIEHTKNWQKIISQFKRVLKPNGVLVISAPSYGCPYHSDYDAWRFETIDLQRIFSDFTIQYIAVEILPEWNLNYLKAIKPTNFIENDLSRYRLYNVNMKKAV